MGVPAVPPSEQVPEPAVGVQVRVWCDARIPKAGRARAAQLPEAANDLPCWYVHPGMHGGVPAPDHHDAPQVAMPRFHWMSTTPTPRCARVGGCGAGLAAGWRCSLPNGRATRRSSARSGLRSASGSAGRKVPSHVSSAMRQTSAANAWSHARTAVAPRYACTLSRAPGCICSSPALPLNRFGKPTRTSTSTSSARIDTFAAQLCVAPESRLLSRQRTTRRAQTAWWRARKAAARN